MADHSQSTGQVEFQFNGRTIVAAPGQTIAGALHAAGEHVLSSSFKYHRPRGLLCVSGRCPNCLCTVDGVPNERICQTPARTGMQVKSQNAWPSPRFDFLRILNRLDRFMPVGFYYKKMYKPRWMWPLWEKFIRRIAGLGTIDPVHGADGDYDKLNLFTDVAVVGGGLTGLHAALAAADTGVQVVLIDDQPGLGGHLRHDPELVRPEWSELPLRAASHPRIRVLNRATVFGAYEDRYLGIRQDSRLIRLRAAQVIIATGAWERPYVFENNDLPGVLLASGAQRLAHLEKCGFDGPAVIVTDNAQGYRAARLLKMAGASIACIVDTRANSTETIEGVGIHRGTTIVGATGSSHVTGAKLATLSGERRETVACRWIVQALGFTAATSLLYQAGCSLEYSPALDQPVVKRFAGGFWSAGAVNGVHDAGQAAEEGQAVGVAAAAAVGSRPAPRVVERASDGTHAEVAPNYIAPGTAKKKFVCLCEDVTEKDVCDAIDEGYSNVETLKRYSTVSMGPCQGKMCQTSAIALCARHNRQGIAETGVTTARPPEQPVPLGVLAGRAVHFILTRRTAMHDWHEQQGARMADAGNWKRPAVYTSVEEEYDAVRNRAGLIDVSTLGKLDLRGADVPRLLDYIYPNRFGNLAVGRVRYGVICGEDGIILDDGTVSRLGVERYFLTTTTGNADAIDSWFRSTLAARPQWDVRLTNVSTSFAAMNLAGPRSREILRKVTTSDVSAERWPYLAAGEITIAGVPAVVLRIGFVGELGYEIHVPTQYGLHVWEAILAAGREYGIAPFGIEAQRLLRLEKQHFLPGVDTDALSNPLEAGVGWVVRLDKPDFVGRFALQRARGKALRQKLVGFRLEDHTTVEAGSLVVSGERVTGRVTSSGDSPAAGVTIGLAWVGADQAYDGARFEIRVQGRSVPAYVQQAPFYDPAGERLKS